MKKLFYMVPLVIFLASLPASVTQAQIGAVIWEEQFDSLSNWNKLTGNGYWGWGNGELEFYKEENVSISPIPGEPGNNALRITAKMETGPGITDAWGNPLNYTSGKVDTKSKISIKYGVIETRVRIPNINLGGWPAVWMLGTANYAWPRNGEIDMMEMGHRKAFRDLHDTHNGGNGLNNSNVNQMVGANAIYYTDDAVTPLNPSGAASLSYDPDDDFCRPYYNYSSPFNDRFVLYRTYWDQDSIRFTVIDGGVEHDLYSSAFHIDSNSAEFQEPFYLIANLAIGGAFTDAYNLGDPGSGAPVSMPFPSEMYIDYIKVMKWNGQGEVQEGVPTAEIGTFGIYTDNTPTNNSLIPGVNAEIYVWEGTLTDGAVPPFEGPNGISWTTTGLGWFGAGILSVQPTNLFGFGAGNLKFRIKIPANVTFKIGIIDAWGNQNYVSFPAFTTTYGLVRDGNWGQATIPVSDIRGTLIDLRMLSYEFVILEENGVACTFGLDDIYWDDGIGCNHPVNLSAVPSSNAVQLSWDGIPGALRYQVQGRKLGTSTFKQRVANTNAVTVNGLAPGRTYEWQVRVLCGDSSISAFSPLESFTTPIVKATGGSTASEQLVVFPNPATAFARISGLPAGASWELLDASGRCLQVGIANDAEIELSVSQLTEGLYLFRWQDIERSGMSRLSVVR